MKVTQNVAVADFKSQVDRMADYLAAAGYEVKRTHLVEASARFQGARDWRTLRSELTSKAVSAKTKVPVLGDKVIRIYMDVHARSDWGSGPRFCWTDISQAWVNRAFELRDLCVQKNLSEIEDGFDVPDWMDDAGTYRIQEDCITVCQREFWYSGYPKHTDYKVETSPILFDSFIEKILETIKKGKKEVYLLEDAASLDELMLDLSYEPGHPSYIGSGVSKASTSAG
jgi:hypothetical protein